MCKFFSEREFGTIWRLNMLVCTIKHDFQKRAQGVRIVGDVREKGGEDHDLGYEMNLA